MLSVRLPVNSRLIVVKFRGNPKLYMDFRPHRAVLLYLVLFKDQLKLSII